MSTSEIEERALAALARQFGMQRRRVASLLEHRWYHDWVNDPNSLGAYSYALVGGSHAAKRLTRPVENTLFFAGEACSAQDFSTAHGAYESGVAAADAALAALRVPH